MRNALYNYLFYGHKVNMLKYSPNTDSVDASSQRFIKAFLMINKLKLIVSLQVLSKTQSSQFFVMSKQSLCHVYIHVPSAEYKINDFKKQN